MSFKTYHKYSPQHTATRVDTTTHVQRTTSQLAVLNNDQNLHNQPQQTAQQPQLWQQPASTVNGLLVSGLGGGGAGPFGPWSLGGESSPSVAIDSGTDGDTNTVKLMFR